MCNRKRNVCDPHRIVAQMVYSFEWQNWNENDKLNFVLDFGNAINNFNETMLFNVTLRYVIYQAINSANSIFKWSHVILFSVTRHFNLKTTITTIAFHKTVYTVYASDRQFKYAQHRYGNKNKMLSTELNVFCFHYCLKLHWLLISITLEYEGLWGTEIDLKCLKSDTLNTVKKLIRV